MSVINVPVLNILCDYAVHNTENSSNDSKKLNKNVYDLLLTALQTIDAMFTKHTVQNVGPSTKLSKKDEIKLSVAKKQIENDVQLLVAQYQSPVIQPIFRNWKFSESKLFSMIIWSIKIINLRTIDNYDVYNCLMSLAASMNDFNIVELNELSLLIEVYDKLAIRATLDKLMHDYSELIVSNFYSINYPSKIIKPYPAQKQVIDIYKQSLNEDRPMCINYSTETGSGKTYLSLALAQVHRRADGHKKDDAFIFVCYNITVRKMILDMCNKLNIPAALIEIDGVNFVGNIGPCFNLNRCAINVKVKQGEQGNTRSRVNKQVGLTVKAEWKKFDDLILNGSNEEKIRNQFIYLNSIRDHSQSFSAAVPHIYICDPESAAHFVKIAPNSTVFIDEPDADDIETATNYAKILSKFPRRIIISSATIGNIDAYHNKYKLTYPNAITQTVNYGTSGIHSTLIAGGNIIMPHMYVNFDDEKESAAFIESLENSSLIKLYSPTAISEMIRYYNFHTAPDNEVALEGYFNFRTITYDELRKFVINFFHIYYPKCDNRQEVYKCAIIKKPFTSDSQSLTGQTLSISANPYGQASDWEDGLFEINGKSYNINKARNDYLDDFKIYTGILNRIKSNSSTRESRQDIEHKIAEHSRNQPSMIYPSSAIIGSKAHIEKFCDKESHSRSSRMKYNAQDDSLFDTVDSNLIKWLYAGVGFYDKDLPKSYISSVLNAAQSTELSYLLSLPELVRGMDYRFDTVMINKEWADISSQSALKQTIGRVGRPGSNKAMIIFEDSACLSKLFSSVVNDSFIIKLIDKIEVSKPVKPKFSKFTLQNKTIKQKPVEQAEEVLDNWDD